MRLIFNRPEKRNSMSAALINGMQAALLEADMDGEVHAVLISGNKESPDFCTGYFVEGTATPGSETIEGDLLRMRLGQQKIQTIFDMHKPVIVQVHGRCIAGGTDVAFMSDIVIAAEDASFGFPAHRDLGHAPNDQWLYHCGPQWAKRLLLTGDSISGTDAAKIGLILKAVPIDQLEQECVGLMKRLAKIDPALLATHKRAVNLGLELMGARTFQRLAIELDARGHNAPTALEIKEQSRSKDGHAFNAELRERRRDLFGTGLVRASEPDPYDEEGRLL
jgi:enoyl-CoA hydratase